MSSPTQSKRVKDFLDDLRKAPQFDLTMKVLKVVHRAQLDLSQDECDRFIYAAIDAASHCDDGKGGVVWSPEANAKINQMLDTFGHYPPGLILRQFVKDLHDAHQIAYSS
ncbi:hypothetical protein NCS52_00304000 [Fusarium sp. LHS14.1]|nr:hypothetical protein NCS52_00304000 [Fusarium sp. LHS14.1]